MISSNIPDFNDNFNEYLDRVEEFNETLILKRKTKKGAVLISLYEYNLLLQTLHQLKGQQQQSEDRMKNGNEILNPNLN
ncbi:MAG: PHD/YefM family antitoxin component YafN of YafNO toxin-antitoxin module [Sphingobacteriales bacterium]|jgi:PHD/YefM family antitoxin component YafN of YafNO toxin-antitoxin module